MSWQRICSTPVHNTHTVHVHTGAPCVYTAGGRADVLAPSFSDAAMQARVQTPVSSSFSFFHTFNTFKQNQTSPRVRARPGITILQRCVERRCPNKSQRTHTRTMQCNAMQCNVRVLAPTLILSSHASDSSPQSPSSVWLGFPDLAYARCAARSSSIFCMSSCNTCLLRMEGDSWGNGVRGWTRAVVRLRVPCHGVLAPARLPRLSLRVCTRKQHNTQGSAVQNPNHL